MSVSTPTLDTSGLSSRAMLVDLNLRQWAAGKTDREVSREVAERHGSEDGMGHFYKNLFRSGALSKVRTAFARAADEHRKRTLPWLDNGSRVLTNAGYLGYMAAMRKAKLDIEAALEEFYRDYPRLKDEARAALNGLYRDDDYPTLAGVKSKFGIETIVMPLPTGGDFRVALGDDEVAKIRSSYDAMVASRVAQAEREKMKEVQEGMRRVIARMRGDEDAAGMRDGMFSGLVELADLLPTLNIAGNDRIDALAARLKTVTKFSPATLKVSEAARTTTLAAAEEVAAEAAAIFDAMSEFV
jgi:hypothetical protein